MSNFKIKPFFFKALCISLGLHLLSMIVFYIPPHEIKSQKTPNVIMVSSYYNFGKELTAQNHAKTQLSTEYYNSKPAMPPQLIAFQPTLPPLFNKENELSFLDPIDLTKDSDVNALNLNDLNLNAISSNFGESFLKHKPLQIHFSGELAKKSLLNSEILNVCNLEISSMHPLIEMQIVYSVQLEEKTGKIFYINVEKSSGFNVIDYLGEQIIKKMQFNETLDGFITTGYIEMSLLLNRNFILL